MTALTQARNTPRREGDNREGGLAAGVVCYQGGIVIRKADGFLDKGKAIANVHGVGVAEKTADNSGGQNGDVRVAYRGGIFLFENSSGGDALAIADIGNKCFIVDDQTVAKTNGSGARSPAGIVSDVTSDGVWVLFDETLLNL